MDTKASAQRNIEQDTIQTAKQNTRQNVRQTVKQVDHAILEKVKALRGCLHKIPERSLEEVKTKQMLMTFLKENTSFELVDNGGWFYAFHKADQTNSEEVASESVKSPIAFRADMDAVCGKDGKPGHYCGHDGHSSILAGLALYLEAHKTIWNRDVYLIFQPAEEIGKGANVCSELLVENKIGEMYGLHNIPGYPKRQILTKNGTFACASTGLEIRMTGTPSHAAYPEAGKNPGLALSQLLIQTDAITKQINQTKGFVLMTLIGMEIGSDSYGVSASDGVLRLTVRATKQSIFNEYLSEINKLAETLAANYGLALKIREIERFPATENDECAIVKVRECAERLGLSTVELPEPMRWSEDFGYYLQKTTGAFFGIGDGENHAQLHTEGYEFPDDIIETAILLFAELEK